MPPAPPPATVARQTRQIAAGVARGRTLVQVARDLHLGLHTVKRRLEALAHRHGWPAVQAAAVHAAYQSGILAGLPPEARPPVTLTGRERQILHGMARGHGAAGIAAGLGLSENTVRTQTAHLFAKTGARSRAHAVALAHQHGWFTAPVALDAWRQRFARRVQLRYGQAVHAWDGERTACRRVVPASASGHRADAGITCLGCRRSLRLDPPAATAATAASTVAAQSGGVPTADPRPRFTDR